MTDGVSWLSLVSRIPSTILGNPNRHTIVTISLILNYSFFYDEGGIIPFYHLIEPPFPFSELYCSNSDFLPCYCRFSKHPVVQDLTFVMALAAFSHGCTVAIPTGALLTSMS